MLSLALKSLLKSLGIIAKFAKQIEVGALLTSAGQAYSVIIRQDLTLLVANSRDEGIQLVSPCIFGR